MDISELLKNCNKKGWLVISEGRREWKHGEEQAVSLFKCHKDPVGSTAKDKTMETMDGEVAARTDTEESHQGREMFASNEIDQDAGRERGGEALTRMEQLLSPQL